MLVHLLKIRSKPAGWNGYFERIPVAGRMGIMSLDLQLPAALEGRGLTLHALNDSHWELERSLSCTPDIPRWTYYPVDLDETGAKRRLARTKERHEQGLAGRYAVIEEGIALGSAGMAMIENAEPEVFYVLLPHGRGRGAATRSVHLLVDWLFAKGFDRVALETISGNTASEAVAMRAGFAHASTHQGEQQGQPVELERWIRSRP